MVPCSLDILECSSISTPENSLLARANLNQLHIRPLGSLREEQSNKFRKTHATLQIGLQWSQSSMGALGLCGPLAIHQGSWRVDQKLGSLVDERLWHKSAKSWAARWCCLILSRYCTSQDPALEESEWEAATKSWHKHFHTGAVRSWGKANYLMAIYSAQNSGCWMHNWSCLQESAQIQACISRKSREVSVCLKGGERFAWSFGRDHRWERTRRSWQEDQEAGSTSCTHTVPCSHPQHISPFFISLDQWSVLPCCLSSRTIPACSPPFLVGPCSTCFTENVMEFKVADFFPSKFQFQ